MIMLWLLLIPVLAGAVGWAMGRLSPLWPRMLAATAMGLDLVLLATLWAGIPAAPPAAVLSRTVLAGSGPWLVELTLPWIPPLGAGFHLALDGLSLLLGLLTAFLGLAAVLGSWHGIRERVGFFHFNLMLVQAGVLGVFLAADLLLFYLFWELMLIPMAFLIAVWGHERRHHAAVKFFLFTQLSGLLMLLGMLGLYFAHGQATGIYTFDLRALEGTALSPRLASGLMLGFFAAFAVKLPVVPLHTWLPDAHTQAPTAGSVILAGLMLKTGAYGLIRLLLPLFPQAAARFAPGFRVLAVIGILYGAFQSFGQRDLKRVVAYTSVSHMGFVLLGVFAGTPAAYQGAVVVILAHGLSTGALFVLAGSIQERLGTRDLEHMGGFWSTAPMLGGLLLFFALASLGLPGLGNFVGEFLVLLGAWQVGPGVTAVAVIGLATATVYALALLQRTVWGPRPAEATGAAADLRPGDLRPLELAVTATMAAALLALGLFPLPVLDASAWLWAAAPALRAVLAGGAP